MGRGTLTHSLTRSRIYLLTYSFLPRCSHKISSLTCTDFVVTAALPAPGAQASVQIESIEAHRLAATLHAQTLVHVYGCGETGRMGVLMGG